MLDVVDAAIFNLREHYSGFVSEHDAIENIDTLGDALDNLLDLLEEHAAELPKNPRLVAAIREVCKASGRAGGLAVMV